MAQKILNDDWSDYDHLKLRITSDIHFFSCEEKWERDYLIKKIRNIYPLMGRIRVEIAIDQCCKTIAAPRSRKVFVECVMKRLHV